MSSPIRPYQKLKADELCSEGDRLLSLGDPEMLKDLLQELRYRTRSRKKLDPLAKKIELALSAKDVSAQPEVKTISASTEKVKRSTKDRSFNQEQRQQVRQSTKNQEESKLPAKAVPDYLDRYPLPIKESASIHQIRPCGSELTGLPDPWVKKLEEASVNGLNRTELNSRPWPERFYHALSQWLSLIHI
mgnify:CR=1 FL=1